MPAIVPYLLLMPLLAAAGRWIATGVPFYRKLLAAPGADRREELDGLRGLLATGVFFHHCAVHQAYGSTGVWSRPTSPFYAGLGELAVVLFFMITGFLFWDRVLAGLQPPPLRFYRARFRRIAPLYLLAAALLGAVALAQTGLSLREPPGTVARHLAQVFALGMLPVGPLNGVATQPLNGGVTWTLQYEWLFYLALPLLARGARSRGLPLLLLPVIGLTLLQPKALHLAHFAGGMAVAHLVRDGRLSRISPVLFCLAAAAGVIAVLAGVPAYSWPGTACALGVFTAVVHQGARWPLLRLPGLRQLGVASYSIYLLHGLVLWTGTRLLPADLTPFGYWLGMAACGVVTVALAATTYRWVEHPFLGRSSA